PDRGGARGRRRHGRPGRRSLTAPSADYARSKATNPGAASHHPRSTRISGSFVTVISFIVQLTACLTSFAILASSALVSFFSAKAIGHMEPSSSFALSLNPNIAYRSLNFVALRKKQTTLPSLFAYAGMPYQVFGERSGALSL